MTPKSENQNQESKPRKSYAAPSLVIYGRVGSLTQGGSGANFEGWPGLCLNRPGMTYRPCSERRIKENIVRIGDHALGFGLYLFDYRPEFQARWGRGRQFGVMIDEVETVVPAAVFMHSDGYKRVDYAALGITRFFN